MALTTFLTFEFLIANFIRHLFMILSNKDRADSDIEAQSRTDTIIKLFKLKKNFAFGQT